MNILFRGAEPADAAAATVLIHASGPDASEYVMTNGRVRAADFLTHAFLDGAGEFGCRNHVVGTLDGRVVAVGAGWDGGRALPFTLAAARQSLRVYGVAGGIAAIARGLQAETVMPPPRQGEYYIGHLGVDPGLRGRGIGEALVRFLLDPALTGDCRAAVLDVSVENPRAQALYARLGFTVTKENPSRFRNAHGYVPAHRRMSLPLGQAASRG